MFCLKYKDVPKLLMSQKAGEFSVSIGNSAVSYSHFSNKLFFHAKATYLKVIRLSLIPLYLSETVSPVLKTPFGILQTHLPAY